eukprot:GHRR01015700.1.p1 GENE.GHRR01015700.1~~GHRR01015700.1.p1  ORF type:complete len:188 (+),score=62.94 GHRR01015700.1:198-761(+)
MLGLQRSGLAAYQQAPINRRRGHVANKATRSGMPVETQMSAHQQHNSATTHEIAVAPQPVALPGRMLGSVNKTSILAAVVVAAGCFLGWQKRQKSQAEQGYAYYTASRNDPFENNVMRNVNKVAFDELSADIIQAARARRSKELANIRLDLQEIELPENHPWATRNPMTPEQEAAIQHRLRPRSSQR